ncbi:glutaredoxin family protein [Candidatus Woesearchaeota archaeon]|nr:glutaredoxin family protein [Candidatus Woesearchaeota archaeon]
MSKKVKIYTTPVCPYCHMVKDFLNENKIKYEEVDVSKDQEAANEMIERSGHTGVPQTLIGDKVIIGFDRDAIKKELKI